MRKIIGTIIKLVRNPHSIKDIIICYFRVAKLWGIYLLCTPLRYALYRKNIWLIREKRTEARDNGYHLFKYIRNFHPDINAYYVITKQSPDLAKVQQYGNIIEYNSAKHFLYYLCAKASISSQPYGSVPEPAGTLFLKSQKIRRKDQVVVFLQHGITKDEVSHELDYTKAGFDLWCCAAERELKYIQQLYGYPDENLKLLGFCRYDELLVKHESVKQILIMPTHRMWLHASDTAKEASFEEKQAFEKTDYYTAYSRLLTNQSLLDHARAKGYKIVFYPHYALQSYISCFRKLSNDVVIIADRDNYDVQQLLCESKLLITDYSSIFFDFAYMGKPVIYYQFDEEQYHAKHFKKGYFDFCSDGFGPVFEDGADVIENTKKLIDEDCVMSEQYRKRAEDFFTIRDTNNCRRAFDEIYRKATGK